MLGKTSKRKMLGSKRSLFDLIRYISTKYISRRVSHVVALSSRSEKIPGHDEII